MADVRNGSRDPTGPRIRLQRIGDTVNLVMAEGSSGRSLCMKTSREHLERLRLQDGDGASSSLEIPHEFISQPDFCDAGRSLERVGAFDGAVHRAEFCDDTSHDTSASETISGGSPFVRNISTSVAFGRVRRTSSGRSSTS